MITFPESILPSRRCTSAIPIAQAMPVASANPIACESDPKMTTLELMKINGN